MARRHAALAALTLGALAACSTDSITPLAPGATGPASAKSSATSDTYIVQLAGDAVPAGFAAEIAAAGGKVESTLDGAGIVIVSSSRGDFQAAAARLRGVAAVTPDAIVQLVDPTAKVVDLAEADAVAPGNDTFFPVQWQLAAVNAPEAWATGATGAGARVAILDGGMYVQHPDLNDNVDRAASRSYALDATGALTAYDSDVGTFWHGTHVAGIVAAEDNDRGVLGVAPKATLISVKVLHNGSGAFSWVLSGMYYAGTPLEQGGAGADIMNMSLGGVVPKKSDDKTEKRELKELFTSFDRAAGYAKRNGTTVIASAGNAAINFDTTETMTLPGGAKNVLGVSATAPVGWALGATNYSLPTTYTNTGKKLVNFSAPGGDDAYPGNELCTVGPIRNPCWVFDLMLSTTRGTTVNGGYSWAAGTSMASPMVAGIAALIVAQNGGDMKPDQLEAALRQASIDAGRPGKDEVHGHGWVNAFRAVGGSTVAAK